MRTAVLSALLTLWCLWIPSGSTHAAGCLPLVDGRLVICEGGSTTLSIDPNCWRNWQWNTGSQAESISVTSPGRYWVEGLFDSQGFIRIEVDVSQAPLPRPFIGNPLEYICEGDVAILQARGDYLEYRWSTGATTSRLQISAAGVYWLEVVDTNGCTGRSDEVEIVVVDRPDLAIAGPTDICRDEDIVYSAVPFPGATYTWTVDGGTIKTGQGTATATVAWSRSGSVQVRAVVQRPDGGICDSTAAMFVSAQPRTKPDISYDRSSLCTGDTITLTAQPGFASYLWSTGSTDPAIQVVSGGLYWVEVVDANRCSGVSDSLLVREYPLPEIQILGAGALCDDELIVLTASSQASDVVVWQWSTSESTDKIVVTTPGTYSVTGTTINGCVATESVTITQAPPIEARSSSIDYGIVPVGVEARGAIVLDNTGAEAVTVTGILRSNPALTITPAAPQVIPAGGSLLFSVSWTPSLPITLQAAVVFQLSTALCSDTTVSIIRGAAKLDSVGVFRVDAADTVLPVGFSLDLPLSISTVFDVDAAATAEIYLRMDDGVFHVNSALNATISEDGLQGRERRLRVDYSILQGARDDKITLQGLTMLGSPFQTDIVIDSVVIRSTTPFLTQTEDGSVQLTGCWLPGRSILTAETAGVVLRFFTLDGREVFQRADCHPCLEVYQDMNGRTVKTYLTNSISR